MSASESAELNPVFDYRTLRLLVGFVAFALPLAVSAISPTPLSSISGSYYTPARDAFVGALFAICALLLAYNGHSLREKVASKVAAVAAIFVAAFPTSCNTCAMDRTATIHYIAAIVVFAVIAYFCLVPFRLNTKGKTGKAGLRARIYLVCGCIIAASMLGAGVAYLALPAETREAWAVTYWAELIALWAFALAWMVSGKFVRFLVDDKEEQLVLSLK